MSGGDEFELVRGSGNVFDDIGRPDAELLQLKSLLAAEIIGALDADQLTAKQAGLISGVAPADFSRIRNAKLDRFTVDRLMIILGKLNKKVEFKVQVKPYEQAVTASL
ncbi:MAG: helix-turn-helix transcriptional regulator [Ahrensia sp.]|nr:helix-turn-helix transcriptional regulator [Ahrensia sp.]